MARKKSSKATRGSHALATRVADLTGPELLNFMRDTLGVEKGVAEEAIRCRLFEAAQEVFIEWATTEMRLACGLVRSLSELEIQQDDDSDED